MVSRPERHLSVVPATPTGAASDEALLLAIARDDRLAFRELASRYAEKLANFCTRQTGAATHREDLVQDVLMAVWAARARFSGGDAPAWVFTLAVNRCRKQNRGLLRLFKATAKFATETGPTPTSVDDELAHVEMNQRARRAIDELPDSLRECVLLRLDAELDYRAIGEVVGCTEGAARVRVFTAIRRLRAALESHR